jgi:hypothetical protein
LEKTLKHNAFKPILLKIEKLKKEYANKRITA